MKKTTKKLNKQQLKKISGGHTICGNSKCIGKTCAQAVSQNVCEGSKENTLSVASNIGMGGAAQAVSSIKIVKK